MIVETCVTNERWRTFVSEQLPKINDLQKDTPLGGEDAERASSLASPRVVAFNSADEISVETCVLKRNMPFYFRNTQLPRKNKYFPIHNCRIKIIFLIEINRFSIKINSFPKTI